MSGSNQFLPFATGGGANTLTPTAWAALTTLLANGFEAGVAPSVQFNTALRQASSVAAAVGQLIANAGLNANDDGNLTELTSNLLSAIIAQVHGPLINIQIFSSSGTYNDTAGTNSIEVYGAGGGGAGGGTPAWSSGTQYAAGQGGASGTWARARYTSGFTGGIAITIGTGGTGSAGANGGTGGTTSFGSLLTLPGGPGGTAGSLTTTSYINAGRSVSATSPSGTGIEYFSNGNQSGISTAGNFQLVGGSGGSTIFGSGANSVSTATAAGLSAQANSGGGGGGATMSATSTQAALAGGSGGSGIIIVYEYA